MPLLRPPLEQHTRTQIVMRLHNLGWVLDEKDPACNVYQEHAKTTAQDKLFRGKNPDFVLYEPGTDTPIAVIEAKRPGEDLPAALAQGIDLYAAPLGCPLALAFSDTFVISRHLLQKRPLKIDGEEVQDFIDAATALRFVDEGAEILSAPRGINFSREELLDIFKATNNLLRKEGLRDGYERFSTFAEILFLKLIDESERMGEGRGRRRVIGEQFCWSKFIKRGDEDLLEFLNASVWPRLREEYGGIVASEFAIRTPGTLREIIDLIDPISFVTTDTDVKGDAFEYFLKSVTNGNKDLGEYFTPRHIVRTIVNLVKPGYGEMVYDPFCGTGGFLLEAFRHIAKRVDLTDREILERLRRRTIYGREITSTARIAKMNMVLFDDGHSNVEQIDSLANPRRGAYDVVLSNIPYSQDSDYGSLYAANTKNGDAICVRHILSALRDGGRAAVIVPESFLYEGGVIGQTRELLMRSVSAFSVVSLPRGVFMPYTPTKTNVILFTKCGTLPDGDLPEKPAPRFSRVPFFVVHNDGFELNTRRKPKEGDSDLKLLLSEYDNPRPLPAQATVVERAAIEASGNWNLRPFYYMEDVPEATEEMVSLDSHIIVEARCRIDPRLSPDDEWGVLEISQNGVFLSDTQAGREFTQSYLQVRTGDIAYNPYRVNIGSIGIVPSYFDGMLVSPAYVVFRSVSPEFPAAYLLSILKNPRYLRVIMNYSLSSARANLPFSELSRIKVPRPNADDVQRLVTLQEAFEKAQVAANDAQASVDSCSRRYVSI